MTHSKILILGGTGSGKTTLSKKISKITSLPHLSLDWIVYEKNWKNKRSSKERNKQIKELLRKPSWIIEGAYIEEWINPIIKKADNIIILHISKPVLLKRILLRYIKNKLGKKNRKKDSFKHMLILLKFACRYKNKDFQIHKKLIEKQDKEYNVLKNKKQIKQFLGDLKGGKPTKREDEALRNRRCLRQ